MRHGASHRVRTLRSCPGSGVNGEHGRRFRFTTCKSAKKLLTDNAGLTAYLRFPVEHHGRVRHSNFIERSFGETKRRTKVIGRFPGETSAISLVWAVLDRASAGWRGLAMTPVGTRSLQDLRRSLLDPPRELRPPPSTTSGDTDQAISASA